MNVTTASQRVIHWVHRLPGVLLASALSTMGAVDGASAAADRLVHRYVEARVSPNGAYLAAIEGDVAPGTYYPVVRDLVIRPLDGHRDLTIPLPCGRVPQCWPGSLAWTPDSMHLSFTVRAPGSHAYAVYTVAPDGSGLTRLFEFSGTLVDLKYSPGGALAMLAIENATKEVGATEAGRPVAGDLDAPPVEQRIAILEGGALHWASPADLFVYEYDWRPAAQGFVGTAAPGDGDSHWWTARLYAFAPGTGAARVLYAPQDIRQQVAVPTVSPDGHAVAFIAGIMSDFGSTGGDVYTVSFDGGKAVDVTPDIDASATSLAWNCGGALRALLLAGAESRIVDLGSARTPTKPRVLWRGEQTLGGDGLTGSWACPSDMLAVTRESFTQPPEILAGPLEHWREVTHLNAGLTLAARVSSITWKSGGLEAQGWLLLPEHGNGPWPMVTFVHGGPAAAAQPYFYGPGLQSAMLQRGWAVFRPNPRGSFGQGESFARANYRDFGYGDLRDILAGIDAAKLIAPIDEARLGLTGGSYGGFMTMWAVTQTHRFKAAVAAAGISNWQSYYGQNGIDAWMLPFFGASVYEDPAVYARSSPITHIRNVRTPTFAYVGERDIECPAPQTQEFWHALKALGVPTSIMIYPGEGHTLRDPANADDALRRTLAWFEQYLQ